MEEVEDKHGEQKKEAEVNWHVSFVDIWNQQKGEAIDDDLEVLALGKYISHSIFLYPAHIVVRLSGGSIEGRKVRCTDTSHFGNNSSSWRLG